MDEVRLKPGWLAKDIAAAVARTTPKGMKMTENLDWIAIAQRGFEAWKAKPHNARWFRKIDGTPIPNDLTICIGQAFADELARRPPPAVEGGWRFKRGDYVRKVVGSKWNGRVVGFYTTELTQRGYAVESMYEIGSVQIYPEKALELFSVAPTPPAGEKS